MFTSPFGSHSAFFLVEALRIGKSGRSWALIRKGPQAAQSAGVSLFVYKMLAFALAGFLAGAAGALLAGNVGQLDGRTFPASESLFLFALAVVGGCYNWYGALIAGLLLRAVPSLLTDFGVNGYVAIIIFGVALVHALVTAPEGIAGQISNLIIRGSRDRTDITQNKGPAAMISISDLTVQFGGVRPLNALNVTFSKPICGLIGPNGAGKTTLLNVLSGFVTPVSGRIYMNRADLLSMSPTRRVRAGLRRSFQTEQVVDDLNVYDNVLAVLDHLPATTIDAADDVSTALRYTGLAQVASTMGKSLNLFERRMLEIAKALVGKPSAVLFDEPGAGMSEGETGKLRECLLGIPEMFGPQVLLIDHDVELISSTCEETLVLDFGEKLAMGPTADVLSDQAVRNAYLGVA